MVSMTSSWCWPAAEKADAEAGDDTGTRADVGADDDVSAVGRASCRVVLGLAGGSVGVDGEGRPAVLPTISSPMRR